MPRSTETKAIRTPARAQGQFFLWCSEVRGLGVRISPTARAYVVQLRQAGREKRITLGRVGVMSLDGPGGARELAIAALSAVRRGNDAQQAIGARQRPDGLTIDDIWSAYEAAGFPKLTGTGHKRASTIRVDGDRYRLHIRPIFGDTAASAIDEAMVRRWLDRIKRRGARGAALVLLKSILSFAESRGLATVRRIRIAPGRTRHVQNFFSPAELAILERTLERLSLEQPTKMLGFAALRLLIMTGCRKSEILSMRWSDLNLKAGILTLERDKASDTGREVLLSPEAIAVIGTIPRTEGRFVFGATSATGHRVALQKVWLEAIAAAGLKRVRIHDLRHSFASTAIAAGVSLYVTGQLLGHKQATTTQRYAHLSRDVTRTALDQIRAVMAPRDKPED